MKILFKILKFLPWGAAVLALSALCLNSFFDQSEALIPALNSGVQTAREAVQDRTLPELSNFNWNFALLLGILLGALPTAILTRKFALELFPTTGGFKGVWQAILLPFIGGLILALGYQLGGGSLLKNFAATLNLTPQAAIFVGAVVVTMLGLSVLFPSPFDRSGGQK